MHKAGYHARGALIAPLKIVGADPAVARGGLQQLFIVISDAQTLGYHAPQGAAAAAVCAAYHYSIALSGRCDVIIMHCSLVLSVN